jgi:glycerol-3-phosphate dehydrogenase
MRDSGPAGGTYTTYRVMAADAVDAAPTDIGRSVPPSGTDRTPLLGADGYHALVNQAEDLAAEHQLAPWRSARPLDRYATLAGEIVDLAADGRELPDPLPGAEEYLNADRVACGAGHRGTGLQGAGR